jgi:hypothetical protein
MSLPLKIVMAQTIARKITERPSDFPDILVEAKAIAENERGWAEYWSQNIGRFDRASLNWRPIKARLPEILEKLK